MRFLAADESSALAIWTAITAMVAAAGVLVALGAIYFQARLAGRAARLDNIWRLMEYWDSDKMWLMRARAAREIRNHNPASDMVDVFNFFDHVGYLLDEKWIDEESAWSRC